MAVWVGHRVAPEVVSEEVAPRGARTEVCVLHDRRLVVEAESAAQRVRVEENRHGGAQQTSRCYTQHRPRSRRHKRSSAEACILLRSAIGACESSG